MKTGSAVWTTRNGFSDPLPVHLDSPDTLVLAFADSSLGDGSGPVAELVGAFPRSVVLACSTAGEIAADLTHEGGLVAAVARFERSRVRGASARVPRVADSRRAGQTLAAALAEPDLRAVIVLSDGLGVNGSALVDGLVSGLPEGVLLAGGLAGDGDRFARTWVLVEGRPTPGAVVAAGLYGDAVRCGTGSGGGWAAFGPERVVTRSEGNVLFELDGRPALPLYREYLGDFAARLPASALLFPLALRPAGNRDEPHVVRTVLAVDDDEGSMTFAGNVPQGYVAQLMTAGLDQLVQGAADAAGRATHDDARVAIAVSCVGRRLVMGQRVDDELAATLEVLPRGGLQVGFYSYGEIGPDADGHCVLHNQTMTLSMLGEA